MGCQGSVPDRDPKINIGKTEQVPRTGLSGNVTKRKSPRDMIRNSEDTIIGSSASKATSSIASMDFDESITNDRPKLDPNGHLMPEEVIRRTSSSPSSSVILLGDKKKCGREVHVTYAYRSQRGYYPEDPKKANQDKYGITLNFAGEAGDAMFAVYDGHGGQGHNAALFAKNKLPQLLAKHVRQKRAQKHMARLREEGKPTNRALDSDDWPMLETTELRDCCHKSFLETNEAMHKDQSFNDCLCGTTAATVVFHGGRMTVCNVGDSRVLLGHRVSTSGNGGDTSEEVDVETELLRNGDSQSKPEKIMAIPLTMDQTPYRRDERERVIAYGAEIRSIEGKTNIDWGDLVHHDTINVEGDPPRIWFQNKNFPGCAFTRSLGDRIAERIGVTAEPEIITKTLTQNDKYLVIASDGIFEFLTNDYVINACAMASTPVEACEALTRAAYDQWLAHEDRTDDITIIVCFLSCDHQPTVDEEPETTESLIH